MAIIAKKTLEDAQNDHMNSAREDIILLFFSALPLLQPVAGEMSLLRSSNALHVDAISGSFFDLLYPRGRHSQSCPVCELFCQGTSALSNIQQCLLLLLYVRLIP